MRNNQTVRSFASWLFFAVALFVVVRVANASGNIYIAQNSAGSNSGADCADVHAVSFFNDSSNWGSGASQIGPGTTVHLCGTISTELTPQGSGTSGSPITILWETNAKLSAPNWGPDPSTFNAAPAFYSSGNSYLILDGGTNGAIEATSNGTGRATQYDNTGVDLEHGTGLTIRNLTISDMYVHTCSLPIGNCNDENGGLSGGIWILDGCSNLNVYNNIVHDMKWGISCAADAGSFSNTNIYNNQVYHIDHGVSIEEGNSNVTFDGVYIHNNAIHDFQNWDDAGNGNHHDGLHSWSYNSGDALNNLEVYNNYFYGDVGVGFNAWLYEEGVATHAAYFNNVLVDTSGDASAGCGYICLGDSGGDAMYVFNNTIVGFNLNDNTGISSYSSGDVIENNALSNMYKFTAPNNNTPAAWDYNNYSNAGGCGWDCGTTFAGWQANGFDLHGSYTNSNLSASYQPTSASAALIGKGVNLTSYGIAALDSDKAGTTRPSTGTWDIGAYAHAGSGGGSIPPPDTTPPTISLSSPANNATISGTVTISGTASDNVSVSSVSVSIDGGAYQTVAGTTSWTYSLNTANLTNGTHTITAKATDSSGNTATTGTVTVTVNNIPQTLTATLVASVSSGVAPLAIDLTAGLSGTAQGTVTYIFYCNRPDIGTNVTSPADLTVSAATTTSYKATDLCTYQNAGTYTAKVIVERGTAPQAQAQATIPVTAPPSPPPTTTSPALQFLNVVVSQITDTTAEIQVTTNVPATTALQYGPTTAYGQTTQASPYLTTIYENLTGLTPGTVYDFDVAGVAQGATTTLYSQNFAFTTLPPPTTSTNGGSSGGISGGGTVSPPIVTPTPVPIPNPAPVVPLAPIPTSSPTKPVFTHNLSPGDTGSDVLLLQAVLENLTYFPSTFTPTEYFGTKTEHALLLFQRDHDLNRSGFLDLQSEALLNKIVTANPALLTLGGATTTGTTTASTTSGRFGRYLGRGSNGTDVTWLQELLYKDGDYPQDTVTGYFGSLTEQALQRFQAKYGIVATGTPASTGYGAMGPRTEAKLNAVGE